MEDQIRELKEARRDHHVPGIAGGSERMSNEMRQQMETMELQQRRWASVGVAARNLGRPAVFNGTDAAWRDWSVAFKRHAGIVNPEVKGGMVA